MHSSQLRNQTAHVATVAPFVSREPQDIRLIWKQSSPLLVRDLAKGFRIGLSANIIEECVRTLVRQFLKQGSNAIGTSRSGTQIRHSESNLLTPPSADLIGSCFKLYSALLIIKASFALHAQTQARSAALSCRPLPWL